MKLYFKYLSLHLQSQLQHRMSFFLISLGQACFAMTSFLSIFILIPDNMTILGFSQREVLVSGAIINLAYSIAECFARGFDTFGMMIKRGDFDRIIVQPVSEVTQVFMRTVEFTRIGRFVVALIVLIINIRFIPNVSILYISFLVLSGAVVYICLFVIYGSLCFYTTENLEVFNIFTDGTKEFGKVPFGFYGNKVLSFLTFILPLALIQYYPLLYVFHKSSNALYLLAPLFSYLFIIPTCLLWKQGRKHYGSVGA